MCFVYPDGPSHNLLPSNYKIYLRCLTKKPLNPDVQMIPQLLQTPGTLTRIGISAYMPTNVSNSYSISVFGLFYD